MNETKHNPLATAIDAIDPAACDFHRRSELHASCGESACEGCRLRVGRVWVEAGVRARAVRGRGTIHRHRTGLWF